MFNVKGGQNRCIKKRFIGAKIVQKNLRIFKSFYALEVPGVQNVFLNYYLIDFLGI